MLRGNGRLFVAYPVQRFTLSTNDVRVRVDPPHKKGVLMRAGVERGVLPG